MYGNTFWAATLEFLYLASPLITLKAPITTAADDIHKYFFSEKIRLDVSSESSARQRIHMKNQVLFSSKDNSKIFKCRLLQFLFGALRVNVDQLLKEKNCCLRLNLSCKSKPHFGRARLSKKANGKSQKLFPFLKMAGIMEVYPYASSYM